MTELEGRRRFRGRATRRVSGAARAGRRMPSYRASGTDLPFGRPERAHGVAMEGYFWRITDPATRRVVIALIGVQTDHTGRWALAGLGASDGFWRRAIIPTADARRGSLGARAAGTETSFHGTDERVVVHLGSDARLDVRLDGLTRWPPRRPFGGASPCRGQSPRTARLVGVFRVGGSGARRSRPRRRTRVVKGSPGQLAALIIRTVASAVSMRVTGCRR